MNQEESRKSGLLASEVAELEAWFASCAANYPEPACRVIEHVKMRTRVAVGEFDIPSVSPPSVETLASVKDAVRRELEVTEASRVAVFNPTVSVKRLSLLGALAAAAVIALVFVPTWLSNGPSTTSDSESILDDLGYALGISFEADPVDSELPDDADATGNYAGDSSDTFVSLPDDTEESDLDEIDAAIDLLLEESAISLDA
jgi:hypothetical protein